MAKSNNQLQSKEITFLRKLFSNFNIMSFVDLSRVRTLRSFRREANAQKSFVFFSLDKKIKLVFNLCLCRYLFIPNFPGSQYAFSLSFLSFRLFIKLDFLLHCKSVGPPKLFCCVSTLDFFSFLVLLLHVKTHFVENSESIKSQFV